MMTDTTKKLLASIAALSGVVLVAGCILIAVDCFFTDNILYYIIGVLVGFAFDVVKLVMMSNTIEKAVDMSPKDASNYVRLQYSARFFMTLVVLVAAFKIPFVDVVGVIIELLLMQPASYITNFFIKKNEKQEN
jgi:uncharacterized Tic20 family protein